MSSDEIKPSDENIESLEGSVLALRDLVASEGWKTYIAILQQQVQTRTDQLILTPLGTLDGALSQEFVKGEITGIRTASFLPSTMIDELSEQVKILRKERDAEGDQE